MEKTLPQNIDAECGVLGSILIDPDAIEDVADFLFAEDFYRDAHRIMYEVILHFYRLHEPADFITLCDELRRRNQLESVGGATYITSLVNYVPTSANAAYYGHIVERAALHRRIIHTAGRIAAIAYEQADDALQTAETLIGQVGEHGKGGEFTAFGDVLSECMDDLSKMRDMRGGIVGIPSGYDALDLKTGGFQDSDLIILAGRPGTGKTTLAQNIVYNLICKTDFRIAFFSLEMSRKQLGYRFLAMDARIDSQRLRLNQINQHGQSDEWDRIYASFTKMAPGRLWIDDTAAIDVDILRSRARRLHARQGIDFIVVDYLQQAHATIDGKRPQSLVTEVGEVARKLKQVARDLNVPVLALAQMSRDIEHRADKRPQLSDLRESGWIEQEADIILFLHRDAEQPTELVDVFLAKQRNGPIGEFQLGFEGQYTRFHNVRKA